MIGFILISLLIIVVVAAMAYFGSKNQRTTSRGLSAREQQEDIAATLRWRQTRRYAILKWLRLVR